MPRPKSGKPPLTAIAVKVPPDLLAEVQRYTDLHRLSISALVREGLTLRMQHQGPVPDAPSMPAYAYNGYTATEDPTQPGVAAALGRPGKAVHQDLHKLVKAGMLIQEGAQRQARYRVVG